MNFAVACIAISAVLPIVCAGIAKWGFKGYDNRNPRAWLAAQTGFRARANAAQANSWEAFPVFAAGAIVAMHTGAPAGRIDLLAGIFIASRLAYIGFYLADMAGPRSLAWLAGFAVSLALFFTGN
jgi:uncharacterized MAPEG superfamily protein